MVKKVAYFNCTVILVERDCIGYRPFDDHHPRFVSCMRGGQPYCGVRTCGLWCLTSLHHRAFDYSVLPFRVKPLCTWFIASQVQHRLLASNFKQRKTQGAIVIKVQMNPLKGTGVAHPKGGING